MYVGAIEADIDDGEDDGAVYAIDAATGSRKWIFESPSETVQSSPTVVDGTVFIADGDNTLWAIDAATGTEQWRLSDPEVNTSHSPTVVNGTVYLGSRSGLWAVDAETGEVDWHQETVSPIDGAPVVTNNRVYASTDRLLAFDALSGTELWEFNRDATAPTIGSPAVAGDTVFITGSIDILEGINDNTLYAVDAEDGTENWRFETDGVPGVVSPVVKDGVVYCGTLKNWEDGLPFGGTLHAVFAGVGTEKWQYTTTAGNIESPPTIADGYVAFGAAGLVVLDAESGTEQWRRLDGSVVRSSPTVADSTVFVGADNGSVFAFDLSRGSQLWEFAQPNAEAIVSSPTIVGDPPSGHSAGSRVRLQTLGHHDKDPLPLDIPGVNEPVDEHESGVPQPVFDAVDQSGDGELTLEELVEANIERINDPNDEVDGVVVSLNDLVTLNLWRLG